MTCVDQMIIQIVSLISKSKVTETRESKEKKKGILKVERQM